jgi:acetyltransferase
MLPFFENSRNPEYLDKLANLGVPVLPPPTYGFAALRHLMDFVRYEPDANTLELAVPKNDALTPVHRTLSEFESAAILREYGVRTPEGAIASSAVEAVKIADSLGYPAVMKIASADIAHKSDIGGVALKLADGDES